MFADGRTGRVRRRGEGFCRLLLRIELVGLVAQFLLGMYLNLFVPHLHHQPILVAHIALGFTLVIASTLALISALAARLWDYFLVSTTGLAALLIAVTGGLRFLNHGQHNADSYLMATGFIVALIAFNYGIAFTELRRSRISSLENADTVAQYAGSGISSHR